MAASEELKIKISVAFNQAKSALKQIAAKFKKFGANLVKIAKRAAVAFLALGTAMFALGKSVANVGDNIAKMGTRLNLAVGDLSALQFQAGLAGTNFEQAANGIRFMARTAFDASDGLKSAQRGFEVLGINVTDANGKLKGSQALFLEISDAMSKMEAGTRRMAAAQLIFGNRFGTGMIPLLIQGREELEKQAIEAEKLGIIWSEKDTKAAELFNDELLRMTSAFKGVTQAIGKELFPIFIKAFDKITALLVNNRKAIKDFVVGIGSAIKESALFIVRNKNLIISLLDLAFVLATVGTAFAVITGNLPLVIVSLGILASSSQALAGTIATIKLTEFGEKLAKAGDEAKKAAEGVKKLNEEAKKLKDLDFKLEIQAKPDDLDNLVKVTKGAFEATGQLGDEFLKLRQLQIAREKISAINAARETMKERADLLIKLAAISGKEGDVFKAIMEAETAKRNLFLDTDTLMVDSAKQAQKELSSLQKKRVKENQDSSDKIVKAWLNIDKKIKDSFVNLAANFPSGVITEGVSQISNGLTDLVFETKTLQQAWENYSQAFLRSIVRMVAQLTVQLALHEAINAATSGQGITSTVTSGVGVASVSSKAVLIVIAKLVFVIAGIIAAFRGLMFLIRDLDDGFRGLIDGIATMFKGFELMGRGISKLIDDMGNFITNTVFSGLGANLETLITNTGRSFNNMITGIGRFFKKTFSDIGKIFGSGGGGVGGFLGDVGDFFEDVFGIANQARPGNAVKSNIISGGGGNFATPNQTIQFQPGSVVFNFKSGSTAEVEKAVEIFNKRVLKIVRNDRVTRIAQPIF